MKKLWIAVLILVLSVSAASAQETLPAGCNLASLGEIFNLVGDSLQDGDLSVEQASQLLGVFDGALADTQAACAGEFPAEGAVDYSEIPQSRTEDGAFVLGDPDAPVTIIEFADFLCPHCQNYKPTVDEFIAEYVVTGQAKFEYRMFPVVDRTLSPLMASMAECADVQGGNFWQAHDLLFELATESGFTALTPYVFATRAGLDYDALLSCVDTVEQVATDSALGQEIGVSGTPALRVRYGDGDAEVITVDDTAYERGALPIEVLAAVVESAQE